MTRPFTITKAEFEGRIATMTEMSCEYQVGDTVRVVKEGALMRGREGYLRLWDSYHAAWLVEFGLGDSQLWTPPTLELLRRAQPKAELEPWLCECGRSGEVNPDTMPTATCGGCGTQHRFDMNCANGWPLGRGDLVQVDGGRQYRVSRIIVDAGRLQVWLGDDGAGFWLLPNQMRKVGLRDGYSNATPPAPFAVGDRVQLRVRDFDMREACGTVELRGMLDCLVKFDEAALGADWYKYADLEPIPTTSEYYAPSAVEPKPNPLRGLAEAMRSLSELECDTCGAGPICGLDYGGEPICTYCAQRQSLDLLLLECTKREPAAENVRAPWDWPVDDQNPMGGLP